MPETIDERWSFDDFRRWTRWKSDAELFYDDYAEAPDSVDLNILGGCGDAGILELISDRDVENGLILRSYLLLVFVIFSDWRRFAISLLPISRGYIF
ncbi:MULTISPECIES: hypothetical protein [unclassified Pseudomonas]|uniref:Uncharacterized protein n=1 Tax=Pseudomonas sp. MYb327 TaxID=2745230 RepID=A0AAU8E814_9PSED